MRLWKYIKGKKHSEGEYTDEELDAHPEQMLFHEFLELGMNVASLLVETIVQPLLLGLIVSVFADLTNSQTFPFHL